MSDMRPRKTLAQCDDCDAVIPVVVRQTGKVKPLGTGGDCITDNHTYRLDGKPVSAAP